MKKFFLQGAWEKSDESCEVINPWSGEMVDSICLANAEQVEAAVAGAAAAFEVTRRQTGRERIEILSRIAEGIRERRAEFTNVIVAESGKPVTFAEGELDRAVETFRFAARLAGNEEGHSLGMDASPQGSGHIGWVRRFPIGVILGITPFNFPLNLVAHKVAPCLASGNTMVLKPALKTPLTALLLAEVMESVGLPAGQIQVVPFDHVHIPPLMEDPRIKMLSFTGSAKVGWMLKGSARKMKVALELGGNAAVVVEPDSDWQAAVPLIASGAFGFAGQSCISVQRIMVHASILEEFRDALVAAIRDSMKFGNPQDRKTVVGPMIEESARDKVLAWIEEALSQGGRALTPVLPDGPRGLGPVLLENVPPKSPVWCQEAFAPLAVLVSYENFSEALAMVNNSDFGLQAGIFTPNLNKAFRAFEELDVGGVLINQVPTFRVENMPYGGVKESGFGREGLEYAIEEMTEPRSMIIRRGGE